MIVVVVVIVIMAIKIVIVTIVIATAIVIPKPGSSQFSECCRLWGLVPAIRRGGGVWQHCIACSHRFPVVEMDVAGHRAGQDLLMIWAGFVGGILGCKLIKDSSSEECASWKRDCRLWADGQNPCEMPASSTPLANV